MITTSVVRQKFLDYFAKQGHAVVGSSSLVPIGDSTLLFTNAGMVQFKELFLGKEKRTYTRAVTVQRCLRASGKHNDLDNVGYTTRHHTFFEMLGNFSFGDYFKREAIHYAWEFLTQELKINPNKLWVTVHNKDQEAAKLWQEEFQATATKPQGLSCCGDKDNLWAMGETGPCGYCSEIFYDHGADIPGTPPGEHHEGERYVEIWNLVFMQFERDKSGNLTPLPKPSVDTGMGLERIAAVMQGVHDNYAIDIFQQIYKKFAEFLGKQRINKTAETPEANIARRVIADHIRAAVFLIVDGVLPSNERAGYVLRSIIRRAVYYLYRLGVRKPLFFQFTQPLIQAMGDVYPELNLQNSAAQIATVIEQEEIKFLDTLDRGVKILDQELAKLCTNTEGIESHKHKVIPGDLVFSLHDTYGFPAILTNEIAKQRCLKVDDDGFTKAMNQQRERSRAASKFGTTEKLKLAIAGATEFVGYVQDTANSKIRGLFLTDGTPVAELRANIAGIIILDKTPFYAESGGQVGDCGEIHSDCGTFVVHDTQKYGSLYLHHGVMLKGLLTLKETVIATIDSERRQAIKFNHSAAHLLHRSLHLVLGEHATQRGSLVDATKVRFDFAHHQVVTKLELQEIERMVNNEIRANLEVHTAIKSLAEAKREGVVALFGEKYGEEVRVVKMGDFTKELCGGTHVNATGEIGLFKIVSEGAIAGGVRRIEAVTGANALEFITQEELLLEKITKILGVNAAQAESRLEQILKEKRQQEKELLQLKNAQVINKDKELLQQVVPVAGIKVLAVTVDVADGKLLRQLLDNLKQQLGSAIIVLATINENKVQLIVGVTKDLLEKFKANELLVFLTKQIAGSGGGRAEMAQGGGTNIQNLAAALDSVVGWVKNTCI